MSVGDTDTDAFESIAQPVTAWILFVVCITLTNIIMLNLLIAIISESFSNINSNQANASYQERARLISENAYLISYSTKVQYCPKNRYIHIAEERKASEGNEMALSQGNGDGVQSVAELLGLEVVPPEIKLMKDHLAGFSQRVDTIKSEIATTVSYSLPN
jgi:hypothetical protein